MWRDKSNRFDGIRFAPCLVGGRSNIAGYVTERTDKNTHAIECKRQSEV